MIYSSSIVLSQNTKYSPVIVTNEYACFDTATIKAAAKALNDGIVYKELDSLNTLKIKQLEAKLLKKQDIINTQFKTINQQTVIIQNEENISHNLKQQIDITQKRHKKQKKKSFLKGFKIGFPIGLLSFGAIKILSQ